MATNPYDPTPGLNKLIKTLNRGGQLNPGIDKRLNVIRTLDGSNATPLKKGFIKDANSNANVQFMFNPQQVTVSHSMNLMTPMPQEQATDVSADQASLLGTTGTASYGLLFDRTYELWDSSSSNDLKSYGCYLDVLGFYRLLGLVSAGNTFPDAPMHMVGDLTTKLGSLQFKGPIQDMSITYTHWTHKLVPIRCAIQITQWMFPTTDVLSNAAFGGQSTSALSAIVPSASGTASNTTGGLGSFLQGLFP